MPLNDTFVEAERAGKAPIDYARHSPGLEAVCELAGAIIALQRTGLEAPWVRSASSSMTSP